MRNQIFKRLALLVFAIFVLNSAGSFFGWYQLMGWYDNFMHFLGGLWLSLVFFWIFFGYIQKQYTKSKQIQVYFLTLCFVFVAAVFWEFLEYGVQMVAKLPGLFATFSDSISDVVFGLLGGTLGYFYTRKQINRS